MQNGLKLQYHWCEIMIPNDFESNWIGKQNNPWWTSDHLPLMLLSGNQLKTSSSWKFKNFAFNRLIKVYDTLFTKLKTRMNFFNTCWTSVESKKILKTNKIKKVNNEKTKIMRCCGGNEILKHPKEWYK